jgi:hypothetical protein
MTRVGAELPRPQTHWQSRLKAHSISPVHRPASVARRSASRGSSSRRRGGGPHGERGATQEPHSTPAQNTEAANPRVAPSSTPSEPGPVARGAPVLPSRAINMLPWVMSLPKARGMDSHDPAGLQPSSDPQRVPTRAAGSQGDTCPQLNAAGSQPGRHVPLTVRRGAARTGGERPPITSRTP